MNYKLKVFETPLELAEAFAEDFKKTIENCISEKGSANISLSGGSTPKLIFDVLAKEYHDKIDWCKVHFYWGDERCVPPGDSESNYGMTKEHLLDFINMSDGNIHRIKGEDKPEEEAIRYEIEIKTKIKIENEKGIPVFDLIILGMGDDGHTASIFLNSIELWNSKNICEVAAHPVTGQKRITVTGKIINSSEKVVFLITGKNKAEILKTILKKEDGYLKYPSALVKPASGELYFYLDKNAASKL